MKFREFLRITRSSWLIPAILAGNLLAWPLAGCQSPNARKTDTVADRTPGSPAVEPPHTTAAEPPAADTLANPVSADPEEISALLAGAELALASEHFIFPARNSALALFDQVLILDPGNETALRGLESIVEHYLARAMDAASKRRFEQAQAFVEQAQMIDPKHPGILPTMEQISLLSSARRTVVQLDPDLLKTRDPLLIESLRRTGMLSRQPGCRAVIYGRSDAEGRWIYQQMSAGPEAEGGERIRASLQISWPARIEVLCFPDRASH